MKKRWKVHAKPGWYPGGGFNVQNDAGIALDHAFPFSEGNWYDPEAVGAFLKTL